MSKTNPKPKPSIEQPKSPLTKVVEAMRTQLDDPLRNNVVKTRSLANKTDVSSRKVARILNRLADDYVETVKLDIWNGKRSDENRLYKIKNIDTIPQYSLFITEEECAYYRQWLLESGHQLQDVVDNSPHSKSVIRDHITGSCKHEHNQPEIEYDRERHVWIQREE